MKKPDLTSDVAGIKSPNPFWLASGPPTNSAYQAHRAFEAGWGGVVWKTIGHDPIVNVSSRYGSIDYDGRKMMGFNNIELITDRTLDVNLKEIEEIKRSFPDRAVVVSLMVESTQEAWHDIVKRVEDTGCDGLELNFGCPHGMSERGMGSAVGQVPEYTQMVTEWVKEVARTPVLVKLTPNVTDVRYIGRAAAQGGADGIALINTINSLMGIDLDTLAPSPHVGGKGSHGGYCGPAVKPIALNMVQQISADQEIGLPVSGIGGIQAWQDAVEFILLGASNVQVCTAAMHYGFRIVEQLIAGLENWMMDKKFTNIEQFRGLSVPKIGQWADLDLSYKVVAEIEQSACIHCGLCYIACEDGAHQSIDILPLTDVEFSESNDLSMAVLMSAGKEIISGVGGGVINRFEINQTTCVGCNLCSLVCPVSDCITMVEKPGPFESITWREYQDRLSRGEMEEITPPSHK